jgi:hypothetical protein
MRRVYKKRCIHCALCIYVSEVLVMIWGAIGWDYKSELVFLEKLPGQKGIWSKAYLYQVLEPVVFSLLDELGLKYIFIEDGSKALWDKIAFHG